MKDKVSSLSQTSQVEDKNWKNKLYICDNLKVLNGLNSESVDLVYLDPPFNSKRLYNAPIGSRAEGSQFKDTWKWSDVNEYLLDIIANDFPELADYIEIIGRVSDMSMKSYITYMAQRVIQLHRILKQTGSIYYHCDPTAGHFVKLMLDCVFGKENFRNEIVWSYDWGGRTNTYFPRKHDVIYIYCKENDKCFFDSNDIRVPYQTQIEGRKNPLVSKEKFEKGKIPTDVWTIPVIHAMSKERTGYPTQKPLALLERIIKASCPEGGIVLDPFCGCATTCVASQRLKRKWIGIDIEDKAVDLLIERLEQDGHLVEKGKGFQHLKLNNQEMPYNQKNLDFIVLNCEEDKNKLPHRTDVETKNLDEPKTRDEIKEYFYHKQNGSIDSDGKKGCLCNGCKHRYLLKDLEIDHIIPRSCGGGDYIENYQLLCSNCNKVKGNKPNALFLQRIDLNRKLRREVEY